MSFNVAVAYWASASAAILRISIGNRPEVADTHIMGRSDRFL